MRRESCSVKGVSPHKFNLGGQEAMDQHKLICGAHKHLYYILPKMPKEKDCFELEAWKKTQRRPFAKYADFETLLMRTKGLTQG